MNELTVTGTRLSTILIVRNDGTTGWKDTEYCLQRGELGIEYLSNGNVIVRSGIDGKTKWANCPQVEGVLEKDMKLNYDFGKYKTANGYVDAGGKDMTVSEWIRSCLEDIKLPAIEQPSYTLTTGAITTDNENNTREIGSKVIKIAWNGSAGTGSYEYGSKDSNGVFYTKDNGTGITKSFKMLHSENANQNPAPVIGTTEDGVYVLKTPIEIANDTGTALGTITGTYSWNNSPRTPVDNVGEGAEGAITEGSITKTATYSVTGFREGFFYGWFVNATEMKDITGANIRATLNKDNKTGYQTNKAYASTIVNGKDTPLIFNVQPNAATLFMAWPNGKTGVTNILNTTVNANMNEAFDIAHPGTVKIGGCSNAYPVDYKIVTYTPNEAYGSAAELEITLG